MTFCARSRLARCSAETPLGKAISRSGGISPFASLVDETRDTDHQFARGELGEGDGGDAFGLDAAGQEHGDAASHDRGLAGAGSGLD